MSLHIRFAWLLTQVVECLTRNEFVVKTERLYESIETISSRLQTIHIQTWPTLRTYEHTNLSLSVVTVVKYT